MVTLRPNWVQKLTKQSDIWKSGAALPQEERQTQLPEPPAMEGSAAAN